MLGAEGGFDVRGARRGDGIGARLSFTSAACQHETEDHGGFYHLSGTLNQDLVSGRSPGLPRAAVVIVDFGLVNFGFRSNEPEEGLTSIVSRRKVPSPG